MGRSVFVFFFVAAAALPPITRRRSSTISSSADYRFTRGRFRMARSSIAGGRVAENIIVRPVPGKPGVDGGLREEAEVEHVLLRSGANGPL